MQGRPPKRTRTADQETAANAFVDAAGSASQDRVAAPPSTSRAPLHKGSTGEAARPWEALYVREDVTKGYALRLPEPLYLKLKYVADATGQSMNGLCRDAIEAVVERHIAELEAH